MMSFKALFVALLAVTVQAKAPFVTPRQVAVDLRGGGSIGPLDKDTAINLAKVATSGYVGGSAVKFIAKQTDGTTPKLVDLLTHELMALNAVATAIALGMYGLSGNSFDGLTVGVALGALQAALLIKDAGIENTVDVLMANKVFFFLLWLPGAFILLA